MTPILPKLDVVDAKLLERLFIDENQLLSRSKLAKLLGVTVRTTYRYQQAGIISTPSVTRGNRSFWSVAACREMLQS